MRMLKQAILNASELDTRLVMRPLRNTERVLNNPCGRKVTSKRKRFRVRSKI